MNVLVARFTNLLRRAKSLSDRLRDAASRIERPKVTVKLANYLWFAFIGVIGPRLVCVCLA